MAKQQYGLVTPKTKKKTGSYFAVATLLLWSFAVLMWTMQRIGELCNYHPSLGQPFLWLKRYWYWPWELVTWPRSIFAGDLVKKILDQGLLTFIAPIVLAVVLYILEFQRPKGVKDLYGTARWAKRTEIEAMGYMSGEGVYVGGWFDPKEKVQYYLRHNGPEHVLCFAPTRSGKGVGLILPTLLAWEESTVVIDIKAENYALTAGWLKSQDHTILRFDPADYTKKGARFNPLEEVRLESERGISDIQQLVTMLLDPDGKGLSDYWNKAAFGFLGGVVLHCMIMTKHHEQRTASLYDVSVMLEDPKRDGGPKELFEEMKATDHAALLQSLYPSMTAELGQAMHIFCASAASGMLAKADKEMAGVVSTATSNLGLYRDPVVAWNVSASDFRLEDIMGRSKPVNLYLVISPADIDRLRPLLRIFLTQLLARQTERMEFGADGTNVLYKNRLLLMCDEFTALGKLPIFSRAIAYMAGYGIKGYFIVQDTKQLNDTYGQDNVLMANCHVRIAHAPNLPETAEYLSKLTGTTTVVKKQVSISRGRGGRSKSININETARPLLTPDECQRLPCIRKDHGSIWRFFTKREKTILPGDMLIFTAGQPPIYGRQILHFADPVFLERSKMLPPTTSDSLYFSRSNSSSNQRIEAPPEISEETPANAYLRFLNDLPEGIAGMGAE